MSDATQSSPQDAKAIREFLDRLSRDKHAVSAHLGIRMAEHADYDEITRAKPNRAEDRAQRR